MEASNRGGTVACLQLEELGTRSNKSSIVCFAIANYGVVGDDYTHDNEEQQTETAVSAFNKVHRVDDHCVLITTGLTGDGRALAQATRVACQQHLLGNGEPPSVREIANIVAQMQHELTRTSGSRPFGVTATVVGVDPFGLDGPTRLFQSEVGGIVEEYNFCASGKGRKSALLTLSGLHKTFTQRIKSVDRDDPESGRAHFTSSNDMALIQDMIEGAARAILDNDKGSTRVDIWLVLTDSCCRGKARFQFAIDVSPQDLELVKELFADQLMKADNYSAKIN